MTRTLFGIGLVVAHAATTFAGRPTLDGTRAVPADSVTVRLVVSLESDLSTRAMELLRAETERIWQP